MEVMDHVPIGWKGKLPMWTQGPQRRGGYDVEQMVRSCQRNDAAALMFGERMRDFLYTQWLERQTERALDPRDPETKMAEMAWRIEEYMNQVAEELWPRTEIERGRLPSDIR